jgi:tRNA U38,U39,U40 pseudouridine synthase TruA
MIPRIQRRRVVTRDFSVQLLVASTLLLLRLWSSSSSSSCSSNVVVVVQSFSHPATPMRSSKILPRRSRSALYDTKTPSPGATPSAATKSPVINNLQQCTDCLATFPSRTALFKHIRNDNCIGDEEEEREPIPVRHSMALFFGYTGSGVTPELAGKLLLDAFLSCCNNATGCSNKSSNSNATRQLISSTQSSLANSRHDFLQQDADCPAGMDTLVVNYLAVAAAVEANNDDDEAGTLVFANNLQAKLQELVDNEHNNNSNNNQTSISIVLHGLRTLDTKRSNLHAEQSCTQHVYHFMVPVAWLPDSDGIVEYWYQSNSKSKSSNNPTKTATPPPSSLKRFKDILKRVESDRSPTKELNRFRTLAFKIKRPWHNYCDPTLRASPNHDMTQRIVDRARFLDFVLYNHKDKDKDNHQNNKKEEELYILYEFRGDEFLSQQVRRIVGAAVAMVHGWLPNDFIETSLQTDVILQETPLAPTGYLYQAAARYHYAELCHKGVQLFDIVKEPKSNDASASWATIRMTDNPNEWIQQQLLSDMTMTTSSSNKNNKWLAELRDTVAPRICAAAQLNQKQIDSSAADDDGDVDGHFWNTAAAAVPQEYARVLQLLQDIVANGEWPATSVARSKVIGTLEHPTRSGSFTVVDETKFDTTSIPQANTLFPELASAVFQLQASISSSSGNNNQTSSHCAVNCNAQFTPHVDSGRGAGQSLSTIVGLGEYRAGEIVVEGDAHDIRYKPLQFDGWKLRHWTRPFSGERFSLVWFTPEGIIERKLPLL